MLDLRTLYHFVRLQGTTLYRHIRRKTTEPYVLIGEGHAQCSDYNIMEGDPVMVYLSGDGKLYIRHADEFRDGRFKEVKE